MNQINPRKLKGSKWTAVTPQNREKHFIVVEVVFDELQRVVECELEAIVTGRLYTIDWHSLKDDTAWRMGWK
jgi:tryptophan-rich hypothetical protein